MPPKVSTARFGRFVQYCGHDGMFVADLYEIEGAMVVRASGPVTGETLCRPARGADFHLFDFPNPGYWNPRAGIFVVPADQVRLLEAEEVADAA
jgi:hypothetical protein